MSWFDDMRRLQQQAAGLPAATVQAPGRGNPLSGSLPAPPEQPQQMVGVTDLGNTDTGQATSGAGYSGELKQIDAMLRAGGFPETESREYWQRRIHETSGKIDSYWMERMAAGPAGQGRFHGNEGGALGGDLLAPFTEQYTAGSYTPGAPYAAFAPPTGQQVLDEDPGYGFRLGQGQQALQQSAAGRGVLNTGGTLKDILNYGQSAASQEYKNAYDRALGKYQTNYRTQYSDPEDNNYRSFLSNEAGRYQDYITRYNIFRTNQTDPYNKLIGAATLGANASR